VVWHITPAGAISVFAGVLNSCGFNSDGIAATSAFLNTPYGVAVDSSGSLYIGDSTNNRVRKVTSGIISTYAGTGICGFSGDGGAAKSAKVCFPRGVAVDSSLTVYIGDYANFRVRRVSSSGTISTYAGTGGICVGGQCSPKGYNGDGLVATNTNLDGPISIAVDLSGVAYVADDVQYRVRKIQ